MSDEISKKRSLSEISHLFLSSVRDMHGAGIPKPQRTPPKKSDESIDLTPEEFAQVYGDGAAAEQRPRRAPISAVIAAHLNGKQFDRVKEYARHLAVRGGRVGLIELDASEFRVMCFENGVPADGAEANASGIDCFDPRQMAEALEELDCDVDRWLLLLPNPRTPEARALLREVDHWVLLSTCDHDGVVSSYRMLKGIADAHRPRLTMAVLDAPDEAHAERVQGKLAGVCQQFLDWRLEPEPPVQPTFKAAEHLVLLCRPTRDKGQLANPPQWGIVSEFVAASKIAAQMSEAGPIRTQQEPQVDQSKFVSPQVIAEPSTSATAASVEHTDALHPAETSISTASAPAETDDSFTDVIDIPGREVSGGSLLTAILQKANGGLIECPVRAPMCHEARVAVGRDRGVVLLAVARQGLSELRSIGQAYRWLNENRELIGMAVPQFAIDTHRSPRLQLLVDQSDLSADVLQPMLQSQNVTVRSYRKLRWGEKLGVFLDAA